VKALLQKRGKDNPWPVRLGANPKRKKGSADLLSLLPSKILEYSFMSSGEKVACAQALNKISLGECEIDRGRDYNSLFQVFVSMNEEANCLVSTACQRALLEVVPVLAESTPQHPLRIIVSQCLLRLKPRTPPQLY
jgi:hypothetical protein